jgi:hypothetical protein
MSFLNLAAMISRSNSLTASYRFQPIRAKRRLTIALKVLGMGLFFLLPMLWVRPAFSVNATLAWDPNTESDLEGYGVYFSQDTPGPPYSLFGYVTTAELGNSSNPTFTLTGLVPGDRYYIALTAYDTSGAESSYSAPVCADVTETSIAPCPSATTGGGGGGGGGGAACFIGTSRGDSGHFDPWMAGLAALVAMAALITFIQRRFKRSFLFSRYDLRNSQRRSNLHP